MANNMILIIKCLLTMLRYDTITSALGTAFVSTMKKISKYLQNSSGQQPADPGNDY